MKKFTLFAALAMCATFVFGQVTKGTIGNGNFTNWQGTTSEEYGLDFNNDGILEAKLITGYDMNTGDDWTNGSIEYAYGKLEIVVPNSETWDVFSLMNQGETVGSTSLFAGQGDAYFDDYSTVSTTASYVGLKIVINSSTYYAYAKIHRDAQEIVWDEIYYNATANASITIGDTGSGTGFEYVNAVAAPQVRMVAIEGVIYIERDGKLYDFSGRLVK